MCGWCCCSAASRSRRPSWSPCFAVAFFHFGIQAWFNDPVRKALTEVAAGLARLPGGASQQHPRRRAGDGQRPDARRAVPVRRPDGVRRGAGHPDHAARPDRGGDLRADSPARSWPRPGCSSGLGVEPPPQSVTEQALSGDVAVLNAGDGTRVRAVVRLESDAAADADDRPAGRSADPRATCSAPSRRSPNTSGWTRTGPGCRSPSPGSSPSSPCWCCWPRC